VNNIKIDLKDMGCEEVDGIHLAQNRIQWQALMDIVMNLRCSTRGEEFLDQRASVN
jgi:hypothetical protein